MLLGVVLSFAGGFTHVALRENLDQTLYGGEMVEAITDEAPIGTIPYIETEDELKKKRAWLVAAIALVVVVSVGAFFAIHVYYRPLDVFYYQAPQKAGF
jgi:hypothetical protein